MASMLSVIRAAAGLGSNEDLPEGAMPDANASSTEALTEDQMSEAGKSGATISSADHNAAVSAATSTAMAAGKAEGIKEGAKAANDRFAAVLGAEGIKGDGKRMAAALDLANGSPDMAAEAVVSFVTGNVSASQTEAKPDAAADAKSYEAQRLAAAGLARPAAASGGSASKATIDRTAIFAARRAGTK